MVWMRGKTDRYIHSDDGRFYISKSFVNEVVVYTLADGQERICSNRGESALQRCKQEAERIFSTTQLARPSRFAQAA
ncbi:MULTISPECIES: hypothetical protein [Xanthomonas]|uniref:Uncharacterized protein n=2 Tax=Xanthomonas TaxID=338 RepID=A0A7Z7J0X3_XANCH|nr:MULTISPECIES: hypothetical protein [Xanthomonas]ATS39276.1 hypothetical protein XcfCFBP6988P_15035 [Xanthomonas citri pv. phaseoli var. fuscans]ATS41917.1 hypothetical protein XcfCFBP6989P_05455 [Xanthomonas citri pv. phaseoli var. fuscans]ATS47279.1 hypothetical protein XcfCFBP6990P_11905 [Xanthomonas citri pv. phaseoli var. fuscans]ATS86342.1 hypothetical protein XcfCFBP6991P_22325 [Xanthomonas citri pv. phaseoli var. fuscans]QWN20920.1 hypothetical protein DGM98_12970 [Xanthomonas citri]